MYVCVVFLADCDAYQGVSGGLDYEDLSHRWEL